MAHRRAKTIPHVVTPSCAHAGRSVLNLHNDIPPRDPGANVQPGVERPARQALAPRVGAYAQEVFWGGMVASAQRLLCSTGSDEWDARGRLCPTHHSKAKIVAVGELVSKRSFAKGHGFSRSSRSGPLFSDWNR